MRRTHRCLIAVLVSLTAAAAHSAPSTAETKLQSSDEQMIRAARARSNAAIAAHDIAGIARAWMDNVHIVTSTSAQATGRDANGQRKNAEL